ncbi:MAG: 16S rRNA (uracil(1498)-N(3))-methyltransferase [Christensenellaceae bacterium]
MRRFFCEYIKDIACIKGQEARHITRVLRMEVGAQLILFDGSGYDYLSEITQIDDDGVQLKILKKSLSESEPTVHITIFQAIIKSDHMDYVIQKCTEIGVCCFVPYISERCVKRPDQKSAQNLVLRAKRIAMESAKQCGRAKIPQVCEVADFKQVLQKVKEFEGQFLLAYESEENVTIKDVLKSDSNIGIMIGAEGGFSKNEVQQLKEAGAVVCSLGKLILRAETAGLVGAAMILYNYMEKRS